MSPTRDPRRRESLDDLRSDLAVKHEGTESVVDAFLKAEPVRRRRPKERVGATERPSPGLSQRDALVASAGSDPATPLGYIVGYRCAAPDCSRRLPTGRKAGLCATCKSRLRLHGSVAKPANNRRRLTGDEKAEIVRLVRGWVAPLVVAQRFGVTEKTVRRILTEAAPAVSSEGEATVRVPASSDGSGVAAPASRPERGRLTAAPRRGPLNEP